MRHITNLAEAEAALEHFFPHRLRRTAYTTDYIRQFMDFLGNPQNRVPAVHVAGTSGKTSTAYYAAALLQQTGKRVGLLISPHLERITERVQINLEPLADAEFCRELALFLDLVDESRLTLTYAEILYAFAYWEFARQQVEYIVVETGLGGLLDATNVISRTDKVCVITDIGKDHTAVLGATLTEITHHKAGIIGLHNTVFCHRQSSAVLGVIQAACRQQQADLHIIRQANGPSDLPLFQRRNFVLAQQAIAFVSARDELSLLPQGIRRAARVHIPGRMEVLHMSGKTIILDGAHNPQKLAALRAALHESFTGRPTAVLAGFIDSKGRDVQELTGALQPIAGHLIITPIPPGKGLRTTRPPDAVATAARQSGIASVVTVPDHLAGLHALLARPEPVLVITGSFYLLEVLRPLLMRP